MLARNFKSAAELGISDLQLEALIKVLDKLERGELREPTNRMTLREVMDDLTIFSMKHWCTCIHGHANRINHSFDTPHTGQIEGPLPFALRNLFIQTWFPLEVATAALRDYLTTGSVGSSSPGHQPRTA